VTLLRVILTVLALAAIGTTVTAQDGESFHPGFTGFGIQGGVALSMLTGEDAGDWGTRLGPQFGAFATYSLTPGFSLQPEFWYIERGAKMYNTEEELKLTYMQLIALARLDICEECYDEADRVIPRLVAGAAGSVKLSATREFIDSYDIKNARGIDFSVVVGAGVDIPMAEYRVMIDVRYDMSPFKLGKELTEEQILDWANQPRLYAAQSDGWPFDWKNAALTVTVGLTW